MLSQVVMTIAIQCRSLAQHTAAGPFFQRTACRPRPCKVWAPQHGADRRGKQEADCIAGCRLGPRARQTFSQRNSNMERYRNRLLFYPVSAGGFRRFQMRVEKRVNQLPRLVRNRVAATVNIEAEVLRFAQQIIHVGHFH